MTLTNADRSAVGLPALLSSIDTLAIARGRAAAQCGGQPLTHYLPDGSLAFVVQLQGTDRLYSLYGENLVRTTGTVADTARESALMASPTHRANILEPDFASAAVGEAACPNGQIADAYIFSG